MRRVAQIEAFNIVEISDRVKKKIILETICDWSLDKKKELMKPFTW